MSVSLSRTGRVDFRATGDPALLESADRGEVHLPTYRELYDLWERQHWASQDIDLGRDRLDWHERLSERHRDRRLDGLSSFFVGAQRVARELGPMLRACPDEETRVFLCTQIADEARHLAFLDRFLAEVGVLGGDGLDERLRETATRTGRTFRTLFDHMLGKRVGRLAGTPDDAQALVEAVTIYHLVIEGMLSLTARHFTIERDEGAGLLPGLVRGFTNIARDEHRHVAFGARFLRDAAQRDPRLARAIEHALDEAMPAAEQVLGPRRASVEGPFGTRGAEARAFAMRALERRMRVIGIVTAA